MDPQKIYLGCALGAFALGCLVFPLANKSTPELATTYLPADRTKRLLAGAIDVTICAMLITLIVLLARPSLIVTLTLSPLYLFVRDGLFPGQSFGKRLLGLVVIQLEDGAPCKIFRSFRRNAVFVVPGFNLAALLFEWQAVRSDEQEMRLGDRLAQTLVIEGKDAKDIVTRLQEEYLQFAADLRSLESRRDILTVAAQYNRCTSEELSCKARRPEAWINGWMEAVRRGRVKS